MSCTTTSKSRRGIPRKKLLSVCDQIFFLQTALRCSQLCDQVESLKLDDEEVKDEKPVWNKSTDGGESVYCFCSPRGQTCARFL